VVEPSTQHDKPGWFFRFRLWTSKLIYDLIFAILVRDGSWQEVFLASLAPKTNDRILNFGLGGLSTVVSFAVRYPEATFVRVTPNAKNAEKMQRSVLRKQLLNLSVVDVARSEKLPFDAGSFDTVLCILALHDRPPVEKLGVVKEIVRVLRRGGTLYAADFDKPENHGEGGILEFARRIWGSVAVASHMDGSWTGILAKAGLAGVKRQSSHSIGIGRISIVRARKR
jgi:ubiquinone/menaquinone biosynthesis C-methylase UbiE